MSDENILINIDEYNIENINQNDDDNDDENELETILKEIENSSFDVNSNSYMNSNSVTDIMVKILDYDLNYNVKQLVLICEYYGIAKTVKGNKFKKDEIISFLLEFEENPENYSIVYKRKQLWFFMNELKNDKFMKKYLLW
jgi:hypothetical protein